MPAEFPPGLTYQGALSRMGGLTSRSTVLEVGRTVKTGSGLFLGCYIFNTEAQAQWYGIWDCVAAQNRVPATNFMAPLYIAGNTGQLFVFEIPFTTGLFIGNNGTPGGTSQYPGTGAFTGVADSWFIVKYQ